MNVIIDHSYKLKHVPRKPPLKVPLFRIYEDDGTEDGGPWIATFRTLDAAKKFCELQYWPYKEWQ